MPRPIFVSVAMTGLDRDGIAQSQTPAGAGNLTLNGVLASGGAVTLTYQQIVAVYSGSNIAARVFTVYGTNSDGVEISETITGVNNSTVSSVLNYKTVTRVAVDAATGAAVEVGITGVGATKPIPLDNYVSPADTSLVVEISGTANATVQYTASDVFSLANAQSSTGLVWIDHPVLTGVTATTDSNLSVPLGAVRLKVNSGTDTVKLVIRQAGLWG